MCLTCENLGRGAFTPTATSIATSQEPSRSRSHSMSSSARAESPSSSRRRAGPSALRNALSQIDLDMDGDEEAVAGPSNSQPVTPRKNGICSEVNGNGFVHIDSPASESIRSEPGSSGDDEPIIRQRSQRRAALNPQRSYRIKPSRKKAELQPQNGKPIAEEDQGLERCTTCVAAMHERIWYNNRYFDHCGRYAASALRLVRSLPC